MKRLRDYLDYDIEQDTPTERMQIVKPILRLQQRSSYELLLLKLAHEHSVSQQETQRMKAVEVPS